MKQKLFMRLAAAAAVLLLSAATATAHDFEVDGIYYNKNSDGTSVSVTFKGSSYFDYSYEYSGAVTIPASVTYSGKTYSVTEIGEHAFDGCSGLTSVSIGNSVTTIGEYAFRECSGLKKVEISDLEAWCKISFKSNNSNPVYYSHNLFLNGQEIKNLIIPESIQELKYYVFRGCSGLTSVVIPNSVTYIGGSAFTGCSSLTSVEIPNSVTGIGEWAFFGCSGLTSVSIGNSVTTIGKDAFYDCSGLTSVSIGNSVTTIGEDAFSGCSGLKKVDISDLEAWCKISFYSGYANPTYYSHNLFLNGQEIKNLIIPETIQVLKSRVFYGCSGLTSVVIPNSVTSIGSSAFRECSGLTSVSIGNSVTSIGNYAFSGCSGLTSVTSLNVIPPTLGSRVFYDVPADCVLYVPEGCVGAYQSAVDWKNFGTILEIKPVGVEGISKAETAKVRGENGVIRVEGVDGARVEVFNTAGVCIYSGTDTEVPVPQRGLYVVKVAGRATKLAL